MTLKSLGRMLVFHSAYTFQDIQARNLEIYITSKDAGKFFESVLTVSPVASLQYTAQNPLLFGRPDFYELDGRNTVIEGKTQRFKVFSKLKRLNFVLAQLSLLFALLRDNKLGDTKIVFADDPDFNGLYGYFFSRILRKPLIVGVWGNPARIRELQKMPLMPRLFPSIWIEELVEKFVLRRASLVLVQNLENGNYPLSIGVAPSKIRVLPLGVGIHDAHFKTKSDRMKISEDLEIFDIENRAVLTCISRLEELKLVDHAILACAELKNAGLDFKLIVVGDGREKKNLIQLAKEHDLEDQIIFAGNRSQEWIAGLLAIVDVAIAPLAGRALLEIGLSGCPVVAYDVDWHGEIVQSGVTGTLVANLDYVSLGKSTLELLQNKDLRIRLGQGMRKLSLEIANPIKIIDSQVEIYRILTEESKKKF
jgi:glycosyltransferase involved in cell wall biosynthesis